jgi:hypothetical protein
MAEKLSFNPRVLFCANDGPWKDLNPRRRSATKSRYLQILERAWLPQTLEFWFPAPVYPGRIEANPKPVAGGRGDLTATIDHGELQLERHENALMASTARGG